MKTATYMTGTPEHTDLTAPMKQQTSGRSDLVLTKPRVSRETGTAYASMFSKPYVWRGDREWWKRQTRQVSGNPAR